jgi:alpha-D-ribose 1-methylphosphonate 5-triphosphate diphosphatase
MSGRLAFANGRIVTGDAVVEGGLIASAGFIQDLVSKDRPPAESIDLHGDYLLPGLVELHTDNLERQLQPRPTVRWPADAAMQAHDQQIAAAGITTVCDAVCAGFYGGKRERLEFLEQTVRAQKTAAAAGSLKAEHLLHLRCEIADPDVVEIFSPYRDEPGLRVVSFMDHTPGQRQWQDLDRYRAFHRGRTNASEDEFQVMLARRVSDQARYAARHRDALIELTRELDVALASHDDTTAEHVEQAVREGMTIAEFPTTRLAAEKAKGAGMAIVMGAPNVILGGSHSGNVSAQELAAIDHLDALSSDYVPVSLLHAAFRLTDVAGLDLPAAVAKVSRNPARLIGLDDRGEIGEGRRADLVRVRIVEGTPAVIAVWRQGVRVA